MLLANITQIMENQMEKKMENEMETLGPFKGVYRDITPNHGESIGTEHGKSNSDHCLGFRVGS